MKTSFEKLKGKQANAFGDIPPGYFEGLQHRLEERMDGEQAQQRAKRNWLIPAAAAALVLSVGSVLLLRNQSDRQLRQIAQYEERDTVTKQKPSVFVKEPLKTQEAAQEKPQPKITAASGDSLQMMLEALPLEEIMNYLNETDEFEF